jgi:hypothetical protein
VNGQRIGPLASGWRGQLKVVAASVLLVPLGGLAAAPWAGAGAEAVEATTAGLDWPAASGKWEVGNFDPEGGFAFTKAVVANRGVGFEFLDRPDTLYLLTEHPAYRGRLLGDLTDARLPLSVTSPSIESGARPLETERPGSRSGCAILLVAGAAIRSPEAGGGDMSKILGIRHAVRAVRDLRRSIAFYADGLGTGLVTFLEDLQVRCLFFGARGYDVALIKVSDEQPVGGMQ